MPLRAIARLIQTMLYARRFFPYYVYNILGGIEEDGTLLRYDLYLYIGNIIWILSYIYPLLQSTIA
jgi:20S proteasome alpha/beta subunit